MLGIPRPFARLPLIFTILFAASASIAAQAIRDRQLSPAFDFSTIQIPVEITSIKLNGKEIQPDQKIKGDDDWLKGVSFTLKNVSGRPIAYVNVGFKFDLPNGFLVYSLPYGVNVCRDVPRTQSAPPAIWPGESVDLVLTEQRYKSFHYVLAQGNAPRSFNIAPYYIVNVCFDNEPDVIWENGYLKKRDPNDSFKYDVIGPYVLPAKQK